MIQKNILTVSILEGMKNSEGCPLCYLWVESEKGQMDYLLTNEAAMAPELREKVVAAKGFCNHHMHMLYETAYRGGTEDGLGYALYMQGVIERIIKEFEPVAEPLGNLGNFANKLLASRKKTKHAFSHLYDTLRSAIQGEKPCPACEYLWSFDRIHLHTLLQMIEDENFREDFKSKGLCLPHLISAIRMASKSKLKNQAEVVRTLIEVEIKRLELARHYLSEFTRKSSWDSRNEPIGPEKNANFMVLEFLVGAEGLYTRSYKAFSPWEFEGGTRFQGSAVQK